MSSETVPNARAQRLHATCDHCRQKQQQSQTDIYLTTHVGGIFVAEYRGSYTRNISLILTVTSMRDICSYAQGFLGLAKLSHACLQS